MSKKLAVAMILLYLVWGLNWVVMTVANRYFSADIFVALRYTIGAVILLILCRVRHIPVPEKKHWPWIILSGVMGLAVNSFLVQIGTGYLGAGLAAVLDYTLSVWMTILGIFFLHEKLTARKTAGIVMAVAGLFILMEFDVTGNLWAVFMTLGAAVIWAASGIIVKKKLSSVDMIPMTAGQMVGAAVVLDIYTLLTPNTYAQWCLPGIAALLYNAILCAAFGFVVWSRMLVKLDSTTASVAIMAVPAIGVIGGVIFLKEPMTWNIAGGMILLFAGILTVLGVRLTGKKGRSSKKEKEEA